MINTFRIVLLLVAFSIIGAAGFYFLKNLNTSVEMGNVKIKVMEKGVDVEIENFKVTHEAKGVKEWELKADFAQINNEGRFDQNGECGNDPPQERKQEICHYRGFGNLQRNNQ